jgi:hypothetical protein
MNCFLLFFITDEFTSAFLRPYSSTFLFPVHGYVLR